MRRIREAMKIYLSRRVKIAKRGAWALVMKTGKFWRKRKVGGMFGVGEE